MTSIFLNIEQRPTSPAEKAVVTADATKQVEKDNCGNKREQQATEEGSRSTDLPSVIFCMPMTEQSALVLDPASRTLNSGSAT